MLTNFLRVALLHMRRHKGYTAINVFGLSVGLACCLIIFLFVQRKLTFDTFHENGDRIFRVYSVQQRPEGTRVRSDMSMPVAVAAAPAWILMDLRLSSFAYHMTMGPLIVLEAGLAVPAVSWLTVVRQAVRAASIDPVRSLRYE